MVADLGKTRPQFPEFYAQYKKEKFKEGLILGGATAAFFLNLAAGLGTDSDSSRVDEMRDDLHRLRRKVDDLEKRQ
jgi:hypothetical protein